MVKKSGLGRGLSALIPTTKETATPEDRYQEVPLNLLDPNPEQPRHVFHDEQLKELSESIKHNGVIQPIIVTPRGKRFLVIAGERRWRATKLAGYENIPAVVRKIDTKQLLSLALLENIQRAELNPIEEALAYDRLLETNKMTQEELADTLGKSRVTITNTVRLLRLPSPVKNMIQDGKISFGHARCLVAVEDKDTCLKLAGAVIEKQMSVRELEARIRSERDAKKPAAKKGKNEAVKEAERKLSQSLRWKVSIAGDGKKGKIAIAYGSEEELNKLIQFLSSSSSENASHGG